MKFLAYYKFKLIKS